MDYLHVHADNPWYNYCLMYKIYTDIGGIKYAIVKPRLPTYTGDSQPAKARGLSPRTCEQSMHSHKESGHESKK